jgi:magnesium-transporting ATPase (P-type)
MDVMCVNKTGTLKEHAMTVANVQLMEGFDAAHVLMLAARANSDGGQDPVDGAIRAAAGRPGADAPHLVHLSSSIRPTRCRKRRARPALCNAWSGRLFHSHRPCSSATGRRGRISRAAGVGEEAGFHAARDCLMQRVR